MGRYIFLNNKHFFRHLKLEIASAILASNDEKIETNISAEDGQQIAIWEMCVWEVNIIQ